jgi:hypothetical protein
MKILQKIQGVFSDCRHLPITFKLIFWTFAIDLLAVGVSANHLPIA